jgi:hypothetical protein
MSASLIGRFGGTITVVIEVAVRCAVINGLTTSFDGQN